MTLCQERKSASLGVEGQEIDLSGVSRELVFVPHLKEWPLSGPFFC
jgi:hypothetical protein